MCIFIFLIFFFFFNDTATTELYTLSLHDALPIRPRLFTQPGRHSLPSAGRRPMWRIDRDEVLARTDLARLATEVCGEPVGRGHGTKWHCPNPDHPDRHPSMSIYRGRRGHPRWKCHSCGEGGTAIDLVMITSRLRAGDALRQLASELGMHAADPIPSRSGHPSTAVPAPAAAQPRQPSPAVERLVDQAADL